eukprot:9607002-Lingulodinium_polyedra.AAC.1
MCIRDRPHASRPPGVPRVSPQPRLWFAGEFIQRTSTFPRQPFYELRGWSASVGGPVPQPW